MKPNSRRGQIDENIKDHELKVLHVLENIHSWHGNAVSGCLTVRIVERRGKIFLDMREYQKTPFFEGYTKRGLRLSIREVSRIADMLPIATKLIEEELSKNSKGGTQCTTQDATGPPAPQIEKDKKP